MLIKDEIYQHESHWGKKYGICHQRVENFHYLQQFFISNVFYYFFQENVKKLKRKRTKPNSKFTFIFLAIECGKKNQQYREKKIEFNGLYELPTVENGKWMTNSTENERPNAQCEDALRKKGNQFLI